MANKDLTYSQVVNGEGSYKYETNEIYSSGVATMQRYLIKLGDRSIIPNGFFDEDTQEAVFKFQSQTKNMGLPDGIAGKSTLTVLQKVEKNSSFLSKYGRPISETYWTRNKILDRSYDDEENIVDILARVILAEEGGIEDAQSAVALVIKNRTNYSDFLVKDSIAPKLIRVICKLNQYATLNDGYQPARMPLKYDLGNKINGNNELWQNAVTLAIKLVGIHYLSNTIDKPSGIALKVDWPEKILKVDNPIKRRFDKQLFQVAKEATFNPKPKEEPLNIVTFDPDWESKSSVNIFFTYKSSENLPTS